MVLEERLNNLAGNTSRAITNTATYQVETATLAELLEQIELLLERLDRYGVSAAQASATGLQKPLNVLRGFIKNKDSPSALLAFAKANAPRMFFR